MSEKTLAFKVCRCRSSAGPLEEGQSLRVDLPTELIKKTRTTLVWKSLCGEVPAVLKTYGHRNLASWLEARFFRGRAEREFDRLGILYDAGVRTCEPLYVGRGKDREHGHFEILATRAIPYAMQLKAYIAQHPDADLEPLFKTIRTMHYAGVYHGSLTLNNLVVSVPPDEAPSFHVLDLPRALDFPYDLAVSRAAWFDLVHFMYRVSKAVDLERLKGILDLYPFTPDQRQKFESFLAEYQPSKGLRFQLRNSLARMAKSAHRRGICTAPPFNG